MFYCGSLDSFLVIYALYKVDKYCIFTRGIFTRYCIKFRIVKTETGVSLFFSRLAGFLFCLLCQTYILLSGQEGQMMTD